MNIRKMFRVRGWLVVITALDWLIFVGLGAIYSFTMETMIAFMRWRESQPTTPDQFALEMEMLWLMSSLLSLGWQLMETVRALGEPETPEGVSVETVEARNPKFL